MKKVLSSIIVLIMELNDIHLPALSYWRARKCDSISSFTTVHDVKKKTVFNSGIEF